MSVCTKGPEHRIINLCNDSLLHWTISAQRNNAPTLLGWVYEYKTDRLNSNWTAISRSINLYLKKLTFTYKFTRLCIFELCIFFYGCFTGIYAMNSIWSWSDRDIIVWFDVHQLAYSHSTVKFISSIFLKTSLLDANNLAMFIFLCYIS